MFETINEPIQNSLSYLNMFISIDFSEKWNYIKTNNLLLHLTPHRRFCHLITFATKQNIFVTKHLIFLYRRKKQM